MGRTLQQAGLFPLQEQPRKVHEAVSNLPDRMWTLQGAGKID